MRKEISLNIQQLISNYGISKYEQNKWEEAIVIFDKSLKIYPGFSDAKYYKAVCYAKLSKKQEEIKALLEASNADYQTGYSINEDKAVYETYPYQKNGENNYQTITKLYNANNGVILKLRNFAY